MDNIQWVAQHLADPDGDLRRPVATTTNGEARNEHPTHLLLLGGRGQIAFRVRVAQAHLRHDLTPSNWSHAVLLGPIATRLEQTDVYDISLDPPHGFGFPTVGNALQVGKLADYLDPHRYPNVAILRLPVASSDWRVSASEQELSVLDRFRKQRSLLDATELLLQWLAFVWGVGRAGNPLLDGNGLPAAAMIEVVLNAVRYDVTPGLESRASCPEGIWQAVKWWHPYYEGQNTDPIAGYWTAEHRLDDSNDT
jgi:hypothetical protein